MIRVRRSRARPHRIALFLAWLAACQAPGVPDQVLPEAPLAVVYRTEEEARRRAEALEELEASRAPVRPKPEPESEPEREGIAELDEVQRYVEHVFGAGEPRSGPRDVEGRLGLLDPRTGRVEVLASALRGAVPHDWSPDRQRLLFSQVVSGDLPQLFELARASSEVRPLTHGPRAHAAGCYGPQGRLVAMSVDTRLQVPASSIVLMDASGSSPRRLSFGPADHSLACAEDGQAIAYVASAPGARDWIVSISPTLDGVPRRIAPGSHPTFTPDGWIVYSAPRAGSHRLYRIRPDGSGRAPIGRGVLDERYPAVSPDGRLVVYLAEQEHRSRLYLRRLDGSGDRLLPVDGEVERPVW